MAARIADADIAVPPMTRLDDAILGAATRLRLVLQFGVGLEGVDEAARTRRGSRSRVPSQHTGNADSTARWRCSRVDAPGERDGGLDPGPDPRLALGQILVGARVHIVGGDIARKIARRLAPLGARYPRPRAPPGRGVRRPAARTATKSSNGFDGAPEPPTDPDPNPDPNPPTTTT